MRVYVHGGGRTGRAAWPLVSSHDAIFAELDSLSPSVSLEQLVRQAPTDATLVAHSLGAIPALLALAEHRLAVKALILIEPALYDVARSNPAIEKHIETMTLARSLSDAGDLFGFWSIVRPMMFGGPAERGSWSNEQERATHFASMPTPWEHSIHADMIAETPTLVMSGDWNDEYEAIASALVGASAAHRKLIGNGHRPQDHQDFEAVVSDFLNADSVRRGIDKR